MEDKMKKQLFLQIAILGLGLSLATAAQAKSGVQAPAANSVTHGDKDWVISSAKGGMEEVRLGELAETKGGSAAVKAFGKHMVTDHGKANSELKQLASLKHITLPTSDSKSDSDYKKLNALSGAQFDKQYVAMMVKDHKADVASFKSESKKGHDNNIRAWAGRTLPTLEGHLAMIQKIQGSMGK
jgi:putative membrane protein